MLINMNSVFFHNRQKIGDFFSHFATSHMENHRYRSHIRKFSRIILKCGKEIHSPKISDEFVQLWRFCLIKYLHNGPFNDPASFGISGLIFQAKFTQFGTKVGLKMLININSVFSIIGKKNWQFFSHFATSHMENHRYRSHIRKFSQMILKCGKDIHCPTIADEFDYVFIIKLDAGLAGIYFHRHCTEYNVCHKQNT